MVRILFFAMTPILLVGNVSAADEPAKEPLKIQGGRGTLTLQVPGDWERQRASRIVEHEFSVPATDGDKANGRITMMTAGGSVKANIDRWKSQFSNGKDAKVTEKTVDGMKVHVFDRRGTYADRRGPFAPAVNRENYRMLGVIIATKEAGLYFVKFYGPQKTVDAHAKAFQTMIDGIKSQ